MSLLTGNVASVLILHRDLAKSSKAVAPGMIIYFKALFRLDGHPHPSIDVSLPRDHLGRTISQAEGSPSVGTTWILHL